jgi:hypothetical protein
VTPDQLAQAKELIARLREQGEQKNYVPDDVATHSNSAFTVTYITRQADIFLLEAADLIESLLQEDAS